MQRILGLLLTFVCSFLSFVDVFAQCGVKDSYDSTFTVEKRISALKTSNRRARAANISYPIWAHVLADDAGENGITLEEIEEDLELVNTHFEDVGVSFYICNSEIILSDDYNDVNSKEEQITIASIYNRSNVINIYFVKNVEGNCGVAVFPWSDGDRIFMDVDCMGGNHTTLSHELGHYFGLPHTHATVGGDELVDGSNCASAGDRICDTPADPTLSGLVNSDCEYEGTATDANGDFYNPDVHNIMSYSQKNCRTYFSPEQIATMKYYIENERNYYACTDGVLPDLFTRITYIPSILNQGFGSYVYVYHYYSGNQELTSVPKLAIYLSKDKVLDEDDLFLNEHESTDLSPEVFSERELEWLVVPENYPSGIYYLICVADHDNVVVENFEDNNTTYGLIKVGCTQTEIIDPIISATNPNCENMGGAITFSNLSENTTYKVSLDGGLTYTSQTSDENGTYTIGNLEADTFNIFMSYNNECAVSLGEEVLEQVACIFDCAGVLEGEAYLDLCQNCVAGTTGEEPCQLPYDDTLLIPGVIEAEFFDLGGELISYHDLTTENRGGEFRVDEAVDIQFENDVYLVGWNDSGEWMEYTVEVLETGVYNCDITLASPKGNGVLHLELDDVLIGESVSSPNTGGWNNWEIVTLTDLPLVEGGHILKIVTDNDGYNLDKVEFTKKTITAIKSSGDSHVLIYPNPAIQGSEITVGSTSNVASIQIVTTMGKVYSKPLLTNNKIMLGEIPSGLYNLVVNFDDGTVQNSKFIVR